MSGLGVGDRNELNIQTIKICVNIRRKEKKSEQKEIERENERVGRRARERECVCMHTFHRCVCE